LHDFNTIIVGLDILNNSTFTIGESAEIHCTTEIIVENLLWLDQEENIIVSSSQSREVILELNPLNDSIHGKTFICRAKQPMGMIEKHITINVSGKTSFCCLCSLK
jgi:hypothetical protein